MVTFHSCRLLLRTMVSNLTMESHRATGSTPSMVDARIHIMVCGRRQIARCGNYTVFIATAAVITEVWTGQECFGHAIIFYIIFLFSQEEDISEALIPTLGQIPFQIWINRQMVFYDPMCVETSVRYCTRLYWTYIYLFLSYVSVMWFAVILFLCR